MSVKYDYASKITAFVSEQIEDKAIQEMIRPETLFEDLGLDWLACVELVMQVEEEFGISISDDDADTFVNIQAIANYLADRIS